MSHEVKTVTEFLDQDYRDYAVYVVEERAIPSVIDGFKPTQRKVIFVADRVWKSSNEKPLKVFQLTGKVASDAYYHHGDGSLNGAILTMAQKFKNSMPVLEDIGQFGSLRSPEASAPRYISTRLHKNFRLLYMDFELLTPRYEEGSEIEPKYFLPIVPTVLLNGGSGIAVGFATNILNRNPVDLIDACLKVLDDKRFKEPAPWVYSYRGPVFKDEETGSWVFSGIYEVKNTSTVEITELPPSMTYEKFEAHLSALEDSGRIAGYENNSRADINYTVKFRREDLKSLVDQGRLSKLLKMEERESENFTVLDENGDLKVFDAASDIIRYFVDFRLKYYVKRKQYLINEITSDLTTISNRAAFIKAIIEGRLRVNNTPRVEILAYLDKHGFDKVNDSYSYLLSMPIHTLTKENYEELLMSEAEKKEELKETKKKEPVQMYRDDLHELRKAVVKSYA